MCDFRPGDEVICIDGGSKVFDGLGLVTLVEGQTYTIAEFYPAGVVKPNGRANQEDCVQIVELGYLESGSGWGFRASRFRKAQRRDLSAWLQTAATSTDHLDKPLPVKKRERIE